MSYHLWQLLVTRCLFAYNFFIHPLLSDAFAKSWGNRRCRLIVHIADLSAWLSSTNLANAPLRDSISASYTRDTTGQKKAHLHEETQFSRKVPPSNVKIV